MRLWPPASSFASSPCLFRRSSVSWIELGVRYAKLAGYMGALPQVLGSPLDRLHDVDVARAAADVPLESVLDLVLGRVWVAVQERDSADDHARGAEATLKAVLLVEALLDRMKLVALRDALDRRDLGAGRLHGKNGARL